MLAVYFFCYPTVCGRFVPIENFFWLALPILCVFGQLFIDFLRPRQQGWKRRCRTHHWDIVLTGLHWMPTTLSFSLKHRFPTLFTPVSKSLANIGSPCILLQAMKFFLESSSIDFRAWQYLQFLQFLRKVSHRISFDWHQTEQLFAFEFLWHAYLCSTNSRPERYTAAHATISLKLSK
jgi:hypothetical protein